MVTLKDPYLTRYFLCKIIWDGTNNISYLGTKSQSAITCSKLTIETTEETE